MINYIKIEKEYPNRKGFVRYSFIAETEKAWKIELYQKYGETEAREYIYFPKSQVQISANKKNIIVPDWLLEKNEIGEKEYTTLRIGGEEERGGLGYKEYEEKKIQEILEK